MGCGGLKSATRPVWSRRTPTLPSTTVPGFWRASRDCRSMILSQSSGVLTFFNWCWNWWLRASEKSASVKVYESRLSWLSAIFCSNSCQDIFFFSAFQI